MKKLLNYITAALFLSLFVFASCGGKDDPIETDPLDVAAETFKGTFDVGTVTKPTNATDLVWTDLTVTFTGNKDGGSYTTTGSANTDVWPASGTWNFNNSSATQIMRSDGVLMTLSGGKPNIAFTFTVATTAAKTNVVDGAWTFEFAIQ